MQELKETYSHMVYSRLLHEEGSLNAGKPGDHIPMLPGMRPMMPGDNPQQRLTAGREQLAKDWQDADDDEFNAMADTVAAYASLIPVANLPIYYGFQMGKELNAQYKKDRKDEHGSTKIGSWNPFAKEVVNKQPIPFFGPEDIKEPVVRPIDPTTGRPWSTPWPHQNPASGAVNQASTPVSNSAPYQHTPYQNPNPYGDWDPNKPSNR
jgi:hypothetical protein